MARTCDSARVRYPKLRVREYTHSATSRYVIEGLRINGRRKRLFFKTRALADLELARIKTKRAREGEAALAIPDSLRIMARDCDARLARYGKTLIDATDFYTRHLEALSKSISAAALESEYLESRRRAGCSQLHLIDLRYRLGRFVQDYGETPVRSLTSAQIEDWLHSLALSPVSTNNFQVRLSALFKYGLNRHYLDSNPLDAISPIKVVAKAPEIFTSDCLAAVLAGADASTLPALALGAFAGLRTAEVLRLSWRDVDLARGFIHVAAENSKSAKRRLVPIESNLAEWLRPYAGAVGSVYADSAQHYHKRCRLLADSAGIRWPKNGLRHSYASYWLALHQDAPRLSLHMGHVTPSQVFSAYRELVTPQEASRYWAIRPPETPSNVVSLRQA
jgi:integrase